MKQKIFLLFVLSTIFILSSTVSAADNTNITASAVSDNSISTNDNTNVENLQYETQNLETKKKQNSQYQDNIITQTNSNSQNTTTQNTQDPTILGHLEDDEETNRTIKWSENGNNSFTIDHLEDDEETNRTIKWGKETQITVIIPSETFINSTVPISGVLKDIEDKAIAYKTVKITISGEEFKAITNENGIYNIMYTTTMAGELPVHVEFEGDEVYNLSETESKLNVIRKISNNEKQDVIIIIKPVNIVGEKVTLQAIVKNEEGNLVTGGNLVFKLNGVTMKDNFGFTGNGAAYKINVVNGIAQVTFIPTSDIRGAKTIEVTYSGNKLYNKLKSEKQNVTVAKRNATLTLSSEDIVNNHEIITFTVKVNDKTLQSQNTTAINDGYVLFFVNGRTLKDADQKPIKVAVEDNKASYSYHVDIKDATNTLQTYTVTARYYNQNYNAYALENSNYSGSGIECKPNQFIVLIGNDEF